MALKPALVDPPKLLPVTLAEARKYARIDSTEEDEIVETLIAAATTHCDGYSGILARGLITQTWRQAVEAFPVAPCTMIRLRLIPVQSIEKITYYDAGNAAVIMDPALYALYTDQLGAYVVAAPGGSWPGGTAIRDDAVQIEYVVGYGNEPRNVPGAVRLAILLMVSAWYDDRMTGTVPPAADRLLTPYRPVIW